MDTVKIALIGFGTIGTGVARILLENAEHIGRTTGKRVELACICDKDITRDRGLALPTGLLTDDLEKVMADPSISIAIELIGGLEPARSIVLKLLESGKHVITANKALLATHGTEIFNAARKNGKTVAFEAAVGGGIPIINAVSTALQANELKSLQAIVNGTCNFILTQMEEHGTDYATAVREAQRLGYAEADPTMDVDGTDTVQKLAILAHLGFGVDISWRDIPKTGIDTVDAIDIFYANQLGYRIKLLAVADATDDGIELYVSPTLVKRHTPVASVRDAFNIVRVVGHAVGEVCMIGRGAGEMPTASAVVGDLIDTILGRTAITFQTLKLWAKDRYSRPVKNPSEIYGKNYLRFQVEDRPGVLADITGLFGKHGVSISSVLQQENETDTDDPVMLIIMTHECREGDILDAIEKIDALDSVRSRTVRMRVE